MKIIYEKWWNRGTKYFGIINYKKGWTENNIKPHIRLKTNRARRRKGDSCLDVNLTLGYININYINFNLQK